MSIKNNIHFEIPKGKDLSLTPTLVNQLKKLQKEGQENVWRTFLYAAGLRAAYQKNQKWDSSFTAWYKDNNLQMCFGSMSQFSKCASAGEVVHRFATLFPDREDLVYALPTSMNALYEISFLIKGQSANTIAKWIYEGGENFEDDSADELGIISPVVTAKEITEFAKKIASGSKRKQIKEDPVRKKEFSVAIATIYASKSLFSFDKRGQHAGKVELRDIKEQIRMLKRLNRSQFDVRDKLTDIEVKYESKKEKADPVKRKYKKKTSVSRPATRMGGK